MEKNYHNYTAAQFLDDPNFIEWVKQPTPELQVFWADWIQANPENLQELRQAEWQLRAILSANRVFVSESAAEEVWSRIQVSIKPNAENTTPVRSIKTMYAKKWWAAAASILIISTFGFLVWKGKSEEKNSIANNQQTVITNDIVPGSTRATLTLADGTTLVLDSAKNGTITKEGNVLVVKQDDLLVYNQSSEASVEVLYNTITTPRGGQYQMVLSDGSKVWLNAASSIRFPTTFAGKERQVEITGEAYFEVAHLANKPFIVSTGSTSVKVLGTHFNIKAYDDEPAAFITLLEGSVNVSKNLEAVILKPGQQASVGQGIQVAAAVDMEQVMAWKNGAFVFGESMTVKEIMQQLSRWYDVEVVYQNQPAGHIGGSISRNVNITEVLSILELTGEVHFEIQGKRVIVK